MAEQDAIEVLKSYGWQIINGPHLEDWDEGQTVIGESGDVKSIEIRADIALIKV